MRATIGVAWCLGGLLLIGMVGGCSNNRSPQVKKEDTPKSSSLPSQFNTPDGQAALAFLTSLKDGKLNEAADLLTVPMRKFFFPPNKDWEPDTKAGYNLGEVNRWLESERKDLQNFAITTRIAAPDESTVAYRGSLEFAGGKAGRFFIRLAKTNKDAWRVQRYLSSTQPEPKLAAAEGLAAELAWAREIAMEFLDALCADKIAVARSELDIEFKKRLAPPLTRTVTRTETIPDNKTVKQVTLTAREATHDYSKEGFRLVMGQMRGDANTYSVLAQSQPVAGGPVTVQGKLIGTSERGYRIRVERDRPDEGSGKRWRIEDFAVE